MGTRGSGVRPQALLQSVSVVLRAPQNQGTCAPVQGGFVTPTFEGAVGAEVGSTDDGGDGGAAARRRRLALLQVAGGHHLRHTAA